MTKEKCIYEGSNWTLRDWIKESPSSAYYLAVHGFDPCDYLTWVDPTIPIYLYSADFPLSNDPEFTPSKVQLGCIVEVKGTETFLRLSTSTEHRRYAFQCFHTKLGDIPGSRLDTFNSGSRDFHTMIRRSYPRPILELIPEEHFVALRSFVRTIAKTGLRLLVKKTLQLSGYNPDSIPVGFTGGIQRRLVASLMKVVPGQTRLFLAGVLDFLREECVPRVIRANWQKIEHIYQFERFLKIKSEFL